MKSTDSIIRPGGIINPAPPPPTINGFSPVDGQPGMLVNITGTGLSHVTGVKFNGTAATFTIVNDSSLNATVPMTATSGPISVTNGSATAYSQQSFTVEPLGPEIDSLNPTAGIPGTSVSITGKRMAQVTEVFFNMVPAQFRKPPASQLIVATVPAGATTGPVHIVAPNGDADSQEFVVVVVAQPTGVTPASARAGARIDITGDHLAQVSAVTFNGTPATIVSKSVHDVKVIVPNVAPGAVNIVLTDLAGSASIGFTVTS